MQNKEKRYYKFAGITVEFKAPFWEEWDIIEKFRIKDNEQSADIKYDVSFEDKIEIPEGQILYKYGNCEIYNNENERIRLIRHDSTKEIVLLDVEKQPKRHFIKYLDKYQEARGLGITMTILDLPRQVILFGGIFIHASFVVKDGQAILFSGKKQIGKSTQAELWQKYKGAVIANGDRAILRKIDGKWYACGSPYAGTSKICENIMCPVKGIVLLEQGIQDAIYSVDNKTALKSLMANCSYELWDAQQLDRALQIMEKIIGEVDFVKLVCTPTENAADVLEDYLCRMKK